MISAADFDALVVQRARAELGGAYDPGANRAFTGLVRAGSRAERFFEQQVHRPLGLTWAGFRLLFCVWVAGPLQTTELARLLYTTAPTVSSVLNTLERRGLVQRERSREDRRQVKVSLTDTGSSLIGAAFREQHRAERQLVAAVSAEDLSAFLRVLDAVAKEARPAR